MPSFPFVTLPYSNCTAHSVPPTVSKFLVTTCPDTFTVGKNSTLSLSSSQLYPSSSSSLATKHTSLFPSSSTINAPLPTISHNPDNSTLPSLHHNSSLTLPCSLSPIVISKSITFILWCSGNHDLVVPHIYAEYWIGLLDITLDEDWRPWFVGSQTTEYTMKHSKYGYRLTYANLKGSSHSPTEWKGRETYEMFERWIHFYPL
ncbi:hypothetical protein Pint_05635 [Pistacia integerrima]|uniref:Uncharacterized protein n=1 Tax=Pistacia integerrima TaxID=434235 RepID=A0ACC0Z657_9ROSI|nr:hypothetical protein Pint_05635 [Pistacia integerrima]